MTNAAIEIRPVGRFRRDPAVRFLLAGADPAADIRGQTQAVKTLLRARNATDVIFLQATCGGRTVGAALAIQHPGRYSALWHTPADAVGADTDALRMLIGRVCDSALEGGAAFVQVLVGPHFDRDAALLTSAGLNRVAELIYMRRPVLADSAQALKAAVSWSSGEAQVRWSSYAQFTETQLARTIEATYEASVDCPELIGVRGTDAVIASHKAGGIFRPDAWWCVTVDNRPAGCVLVNDSPAVPVAEVAYLGVAGEFRGLRLGRALVNKALADATARGRVVMSLAVDSRNEAALKLYEGFAFKPVSRRFVHVRLPGIR